MNLKIIMLSKEARQKEEYILYNSIYIYSRKHQLTYSDGRQNSGCLWGGRKKGHEETLGGDTFIHYLGVMIGSWVCMHIKIYQIVHLKYVQFIVY